MHDYIGKQLGNYRVVQLVGRGGFAEVYVGEHVYLRSFAALKVLHTVLTDEEQAAFVQEAQTLVRLRHPHIIRVLDFSMQAGVPFLVMDYATGGSLRQRHPPGTRLSLNTVISYVKQIASALHYAHSQHLIHRDIKPENVLIGSRDELLLSDFGLALLARHTHPYSTHASANQPIGTSRYIAPEQLQGHPLPSSDQYALAVVVYEWLCGMPPFTGTPLEVAMQHLSLSPPSLCEYAADLSPTLDAVIMQALAKEPKQRFPDVLAFVRALENAQQASSPPSLLSTDAVQKGTSIDFTPQLTPESLPRLEPLWNVPAILTSLIGREQDVATLSTLLTSPEVHLVTLLGTGGIGKTRLSLQIATEVRSHFADGVCFVPLASINEAERVIPTIAQQLGIQETGTQPIFEQVKDSLRKRHLLLILDNIEQVVASAPAIEALLIACPQLRILVTSRIVLHIQAEFVFSLAPLAVPDLSQPLEGATLAKVSSTALFIQRARFISTGLPLTAANVRAIAEICIRLDGLPLAIELAAARIKLLPPQALLARLSHSLDILTGGIRTLSPRHQTLRNTIKWSYDLLEASEKRLFRRLAVFVGGWTLEAVEAVCYYEMQQARVSALDEVTSLLDNSLLLQIEKEGKQPRLLMLMTVREYGLECLYAQGEAKQTYMAHARYYLSIAEEAERQQFGGEQSHWLERLEQEHDNLRVALNWLNEQQEIELALRLSTALYWFWSVRGYINEGHVFLEKALANSEGVTPQLRARALKNAGGLAYNLRKYDLTETRCQESLMLYRQLGDAQGCAMALYWLGVVACWARCNYAQARILAEESLTLHRELQDKSGMADSLLILNYVELHQGQYAEAYALLEQAFTYFKEVDDTWGMAYTLQYMGRVLLEQEQYEAASTKVEESLALSIELGYMGGIAYALGLKGHVALRQGHIAVARTSIAESLAKHHERGELSGIAESLFLQAKVAQAEGKYTKARSLYEECLLLAEKQGERDTQIYCLEGLGEVVVAQELPIWASLLWGTAARLRAEQNKPMSPLAHVDYAPAEAMARTLLGEKRFKAYWSQGYEMTTQQVIAAELHLSSQGTSTPSPADPKAALPVTYPAGLTTREVDVLRLIAQGLMDAQIAEQLVISIRTVNKHATTIYSKIGVSTRSAATRYAIEHKLV